ncbi:MAG: choice-of-anchor L domain-containing protein, partial [Bacteroidota bacterium]
MRNILFVLIALISGYSVIYGQTFNLNATNTGTTQTTCNATLYDSGGPSGTYQNSENYSITFCSGTTDCMQIQFLGTFQVEAGWDEVNIYDGSSIAAPLLASLDGSTLPPSYTSSTPCITIQFTSDGSVTQAGFQANIVCTPNCYVPPPPPTNIGPCSATAVTVNSNCIYTTYTNVSAPGSGIPMPSCSWSYMGGDVWFEAVVPASGLLEVSVSQGTVTEAGMAIYSGPDCNNLTEILCNEPWAMPFLLTVPSGLGLAGQTVWIRIWEQNNDNQGTFDLCVYEPPPSIEVDITTYTPEELVLDILVTGCLQADNVVYTGDPQAIGYFYNAYGVGIQEGVIMSSGYVMNAPGHGNNTFTSDMLTTSGGDPLLNAIVTPDVTTDVTILEFDFIPSSDSLTFDFIFGSEEYPEYVFSFNDVFAFFLSGTNPGGGNYVNQNIALIPGTTTPVSIYNVNNGSGSPPTGPCVNCQYYVDNWAGTYAITYDGYTTPITARAWVVPCQTYHIKLAVADVNDMAFDSAVLLKAGSFSSGGQVTMNNYESSGVQSNQIIEGCTNYWVFSRLDTLDLTDTIFVDLILSGTADTATDFNNFSSQFYILPGQIYDTLFYSAIMDNLPEGTEYIVFTVVNGCPCSTTTQSDTIWVIDNFSLQPTITPNSQICSSNNFTVNTTVNPALPSGFVSYIWSTGDSTASITVSPPTTTTYTVTITHTCMPDTALSMTLTVIPDLGAGFMSSVPGACIGDPITFTFTDTASVNVVYQWTFTNGTPASGNTQGPYTVTWNAAGTYDISLHVDDNGCVGDSTITVDIWPNPQVSFTPVDALCYNSCDGSITANPLGTSTPYTYIWDDPMAQTTQTASNLCAGTFNVTFTNSDGCVGTSSSSISQPAQLTSTISGVNVLCFGGNNGSASLTPAGGIQPYTYLWSDGQTTQDASGLVAGTYTATVTDDNGCTVTQSIVIQGPASPLSASLTSNDISCYGYTDGNIDLTVTGGTVPYSYAWNTGQTIQDITNAPAGNYSVVITDNNGCTTTQAVVITQPTELIYTTSVTDATCWGQSDGVVTISVSQGTPPYTYIWSNGMSGYSLMNVPGGTYSVTATDNNGCTVTETLFVDEPDKVIAAASPDKWICIGQSVILNTSATGGNPGYTYHWSTGGTGSTLTVNPVVTTQYWVYAEDVNSCVSSKEYITVNVFLPISVDVSINETEIC